MSEREYTPHQVLLLVMHNVGAIMGKTGKTFEELTKLTNLRAEDLQEVLATQMNSGYIICSTDPSGVNRYQLTGRGIIRVSSLYT
jgi:hypothetical protein